MNVHTCRFVVITGGPGAGKTALLELVRKHFCEHIAVLPEAAGIVFGGGFPRGTSGPARRAAQLAIFHVQTALENLIREEDRVAVALCDRGTLDGLAYWNDDPQALWSAVNSTREAELARYDAVIHLRTPPVDGGYNHQNPLRVESAAEAALIDERIAVAWQGHPRLVDVDNASSFLDKVAAALVSIRAEVPACCRGHEIPVLR